MRKFELVLEYPGSPRKGTIVETDDEGRYEFTSVEGYPETWKEIVEKPKEWEIVKLKTLSGAILTYDGEKCIHRTDQKDTTNTFNLSNTIQNSSIYAIKRLSDGEIFTIGDAVQLIPGNWQSSNCKISKIDIKDNNIIFTITDNVASVSYSQGIQAWRKAKKKVLFTTEDGVEIFDNDNEVFIPQISDWSGILPMLACYVVAAKDKKDKSKVFAFRKNAEQFILMNKPCLSITDVFSISREIDFEAVEEENKFENSLKELVKSRLNE